ncbi:MAG: hypothetical protein EBU90_13765, partial [Proteobacteria bacterium]|nr:hypothetical protein [Pseudomonadota bacterium]
MYPNIYPPSSFIDIPRTYKKGKARGFIVKNAQAVGFVNKQGNIKRLSTPVEVAPGLDIPTVQDPHQMIDITTQPVANLDEQTEITHQIQNEKPIADQSNTTPIIKSLIYNPIQNDFIPVTDETKPEVQKQIIEDINNQLIPTRLPEVIPGVAGLLTQGDQVVGIVDTNNKLQQFENPLDTEPTDTESIVTEGESQTSDTESIEKQLVSDTESQTSESESIEKQLVSDTESQTSDTDSIKTETESEQSEPVDIVPTTETEPESEPNSILTETESDAESITTEPESETESIRTEPESEPDSIRTEPESESESITTEPESESESITTEPESEPELVKTESVEVVP